MFTSACGHDGASFSAPEYLLPSKVRGTDATAWRHPGWWLHCNRDADREVIVAPSRATDSPTDHQRMVKESGMIPESLIIEERRRRERERGWEPIPLHAPRPMPYEPDSGRSPESPRRDGDKSGSVVIFYRCISVNCVQNGSMFLFHIYHLTSVLRVLVVLRIDIDHYRNQTTNR